MRRQFSFKSRSSLSPNNLQNLLDCFPRSGPINIVCVGAHPDDPEAGCGGTLASLASAGHNVTLLYLTRGEAGIWGSDWQTAAAVRTAEAEKHAVFSAPR